MNSNITSSSDDMIEIQIEESLGRETLMAIDSANFREDIFSIIGFLIILVLTTVAGIMGPPPDEFKENVFIFEDNLKSYKKLELNGTNPVNRFLKLYLCYESDKKTYLSIGYSYIINFQRKGETIRKSTKQDQGIPIIFSESRNQYEPHLIFIEKLVDFDFLSLEISVQTNVSIDEMVLRIETGFRDHSMYQLYFRSVFIFINISFMLFFVFRLSAVSFSFWHLEQKMTIPLILFLIFYNNPLYYFQLYYPSKFLVYCETILSSLFVSYFRFYLLVLFNSLRFKNRKTDKCFFMPKIIFLFVNFLFSAIKGVYFDELSLSPYSFSGSNIINSLNWIENAIFYVFCLWSVYSIILAGRDVDITERYKFLIYIISGVLALILLVMSKILSELMPIFSTTSLGFVTSFSVENVFILLMAYFHWPYEVLQDQSYLDGEDPNNAALAGFYVNEASDE